MDEFSRPAVDSLLRQQVELIGPEGVSLDSLWRAAGCPGELFPRRWLVEAAPLIAGFVQYLLEAVRKPPGLAEPANLVRIWTGENSEPWQTGDVISHEFLARVYAATLRTSSECVGPEEAPASCHRCSESPRLRSSSPGWNPGRGPCSPG